MNKSWLLTYDELRQLYHESFVRADIAPDPSICRAQHLKTLEWFEKGWETVPCAGDGYRRISEELWQVILAKAREEIL